VDSAPIQPEFTQQELDQMLARSPLSDSLAVADPDGVDLSTKSFRRGAVQGEPRPQRRRGGQGG